MIDLTSKERNERTNESEKTVPYKAEVKIPASHLRSGDDILIGDKSTSVVAEVKSATAKTKWVHVEIICGDDSVHSTERYGIDEQVTVIRARMTLAEEVDAELQVAVRRIRKRIAAAPGLLVEAKEKLLTKLDQHADFHRHAYESYIETQVEARLWGMVELISKNREMNVRDAARLLADDIKDGLLEIRLTSRSTSASANFAEDIETETKARWARSLERYL